MIMEPASDEEQPAPVTSPPSPAAALRAPVKLPPVAPEVREALESTGRLPRSTAAYQVSDLLALAIHNGASDLHLRVGEPPLYRVDGRLIRAEGPPINADEAISMIEAFTPADVIQT